jgi:hypothetical protein
MLEMGLPVDNPIIDALLAHGFLKGVDPTVNAVGIRLANQQKEIHPKLTLLESQKLARMWENDWNEESGSRQSSAIGTGANAMTVEACQAKITELEITVNALSTKGGGGGKKKQAPAKVKRTFCHKCGGKAADHNTTDCPESKKDPVQHKLFLEKEAKFLKRMKEKTKA